MVNYKDKDTCYYINSLLRLILGISILAYLVIGIIFLVQDYNIWNNCYGSTLWIYVLVSIILTINKCNFKVDTDDFVIIQLVCYLLIELSLSIWGGIELFDISSNCTKLEYSNLRIYGLVTFSMQLLTIIILIVIPLICYKFSNNI
jgi:hypothetical protein